jgi:hypothetical protein
MSDDTQLGPGAGLPKGFRLAQDAAGNAIDVFTPQERAERTKAAEAARVAGREADKGAESIFDDPKRDPDALDATLSALMLYPESIPGMETSEMRALRQREELVQSREAAKRRVAGDIEEGKVSPEASAYIRDMMKPDPTEEDEEDEMYRRQEAELERELEAEQGWDED